MSGSGFEPPDGRTGSTKGTVVELQRGDVGLRRGGMLWSPAACVRVYIRQGMSWSGRIKKWQRRPRSLM